MSQDRLQICPTCGDGFPYDAAECPGCAAGCPRCSKGPVRPEASPTAAENDYRWDGEPFWLRIGDAVIHISLSQLSARVYVDTYRNGEEDDEPMDSALLALPGGPETGPEE